MANRDMPKPSSLGQEGSLAFTPSLPWLSQTPRPLPTAVDVGLSGGWEPTPGQSGATSAGKSTRKK